MKKISPQINKIYKGNCLKVMKKWKDNIFNACITDPPYSMSKKKGLGWAFSSHVTMQEAWDIFTKEEYIEFTKQWLKEVTRVVKPNGNIFIFGSFHNIFTIGFILQEMDKRVLQMITWFKPNAQPSITCRTFTESTEYIIWACNNAPKKAKKWTFNYKKIKGVNISKMCKKCKRNNVPVEAKFCPICGGKDFLTQKKQMRNMWKIPLTPKSEKTYGSHPTQKPLAVLKRIILAGTNKNNLILDCFSGTGTTAVAAQSLGRNWIMIEKEKKYNKIARERLKHLQK